LCILELDLQTELTAIDRIAWAVLRHGESFSIALSTTAESRLVDRA